MPALDDMRREILQIYADEAAEALTTMERLLLELGVEDGRPAPASTLDEAGRIVHGLKGTAGAIGARDLEAVFHAAETVLGGLRGRPATPQALRALEAAAKAAAATIRARMADPDAGKPLLQDVLAGLQAAADPLRASPSAPAPPSPPPEPGPPPDRVRDDGPASIRVPLARLGALEEWVADLHAAVKRVEGTQESHAELTERLDEVHQALDGGRGGRVDLPSVARAVAETAATARRTQADWGEAARELSRIGVALREEIRRLRLRPFHSITPILERGVRELARSCGKRVRLELVGADAEVDRLILDRVREPLLHLLRNAIDHGLERPDERRAAGKPEEGRVELSVVSTDTTVRIDVADDGRGVDVERVLAAAGAHASLPDAPDARSRAAVELIFRQGLSTAREVTTTSGRGIGLAEVRAAVIDLGGTLEVATGGAGTRFSIVLPTDLSVRRGLVVAVGEERYVLPAVAVQRVVRVEPPPRHRTLVELDGQPAQALELGALLGVQRSRPTGERGRLGVLTRATTGRLLLLVDGVLGDELFVEQDVPAAVEANRFVSGLMVTIGGAIIPVLLVDALGDASVGAPVEERSSFTTLDARATRVLVADDSHATRVIMASTLGVLGYEVTMAEDGAEALRLLRERPFDMVVSDVEMPRLTGLQLAAAIRGDERLRDLPVLLVTSRGSEADRATGAAAGADAYIVKGDFERGHFIDEVRRLSGGPRRSVGDAS